MKKQIGLAMMIFAIAGCSPSGDSPKGKVVPTQSVAEPTPTTPAPLKLSWSNLREAIAETRAKMTDIQGGDLSDGAALLALWGDENMRWNELQEIPMTKYGLVMKDPDAQRGKKMCVSGKIIEIALDKSVPGKRIFEGGMFSDAGEIYRFIALHSTGEIMANSRARFCGVVTGQQHYQNSAGGVAHSVHLVGMFDLPENKSVTSSASS